MLVRFVVSALSLGVATWVLPGLTLQPGPFADQAVTIAIVAAIFGLVNSLTKPLFGMVQGPLLQILLGLGLLVINACLLLLTSWVCAQFHVGWSVDGFWWALPGAAIVSTVSFVLNVFVVRRGEEHR